MSKAATWRMSPKFGEAAWKMGKFLFLYNKQPYTEGTFWQVSKDGEVLGHILGTIHMNDEKVTKLDKKIMDIFDNSVGYSIEAFPSSHLWNPYHGFENIKKKMMFEDKTLADVAGEKTANDVFQILTKNGVNEEYATKINQSKIWFATTGPTKDISPRYFEVMLSKTLLCCNKMEYEYEEMFIDGQNCIMYDNNLNNLTKKIDYYLNNETKRNEIISNAYDLAINNYTWMSMAKKLVSKILEMKNEL